MYLQVREFLFFSRERFSKLGPQLDRIFQANDSIIVSDLSQINMEKVLEDIFIAKIVKVLDKSSYNEADGGKKDKERCKYVEVVFHVKLYEHLLVSQLL